MPHLLGWFAFSLPAPRPIFEAEFLASFYGIGKYRPISNNIHLIGDNLGALFCLKRGSSCNLFADKILKSSAHFWLNSPFFLNISYIKSAENPADFYTRYLKKKLVGQFFTFQGFCVFCRILL